MLQHHIQKHIIATLALVDKAHFTDLRPKQIDSNVFTYHLKQLIGDKLVEKQDRLYSLTPDGRRLGIEAKNNQIKQLSKAYSVVFVALRNKQGHWLLRKRLYHPLYGRVGFIHTHPEHSTKIVSHTEADLFAQTGIKANLKICGSGYVSTYSKDGLESYLHFTVVTGTVNSNSLPISSDVLSEFKWYKESELKGVLTVPSLDDVLKHIKACLPDRHFFVELEYHI